MCNFVLFIFIRSECKLVRIQLTVYMRLCNVTEDVIFAMCTKCNQLALYVPFFTLIKTTAFYTISRPILSRSNITNEKCWSNWLLSRSFGRLEIFSTFFIFFGEIYGSICTRSPNTDMFHNRNWEHVPVVVVHRPVVITIRIHSARGVLFNFDGFIATDRTGFGNNFDIRYGITTHYFILYDWVCRNLDLGTR